MSDTEIIIYWTNIEQSQFEDTRAMYDNMSKQTIGQVRANVPTTCHTNSQNLAFSHLFKCGANWTAFNMPIAAERCTLIG